MLLQTSLRKEGRDGSSVIKKTKKKKTLIISR